MPPVTRPARLRRRLKVSLARLMVNVANSTSRNLARNVSSPWVSMCALYDKRYTSTMHEHKKIAVLYHGGCPDGFGGAYAAWKKFGNMAEYIPLKHGKPAPK